MKGLVSNGQATNDPEAEILDYSLVKANTKSLSVAYLLCIFFGIFGLHHFYLRRLGYGFTYTVTGGLFLVGWIVDIFRLPSLVRNTNDKIIRSNRDGVSLDELEKERHLSDAYVMYLPPFGLLGFHHFYLNRFGFGALYFCTFGLLGFGWILDFFRMSHLVAQENKKHQKALNDAENQDGEGDAEIPRKPLVVRKRLDDAIVMSFGPVGILGFHQIYLGNLLLGFIYIITLANCGVCWIADMLRIRQLVQEANNEIDAKPGGMKKNSLQAYLLWLPPAGLLGAHQFYLERPCSGLLRSATLGLFLFGWIYDFFKINHWVNSHNQKQELQERVTEIEMQESTSDSRLSSTTSLSENMGGYDPDMINPFTRYCCR
ncbi:uncharacterized protein LOC120327897 [Styela clava]|uniref:uncharacterized protein LOC120327897 n=1 Tax=Styela clava TaxID=7725 RepID=UPI001939882E|nr:uncharacterized protein LOC120327897 [Styela clava]